MTPDAGWAIVQGVLGASVVVRLARSAGGTTIRPAATPPPPGTIGVVVPVIDEAARLEPCLRGLLAAGPEVGDILVVDGGSGDGTPELARALGAGDPRLRVIDASPVPADWNGKAWGLDVGLRATAPSTRWIATVDADVRPQPGALAAVVTHAQARGVRALSVATRQELAGRLQAILHPAMLATLIYRFGIPGREAHRVADVQANGQCFVGERALLLEHDAFGTARASRCEDVTVARALVAAGVAVGFYEAGDLVRVRMHESWRETWTDWPRSLGLRDRFAPFGGWAGWCEIALVQALPLPLAVALAAAHAVASPAFAVAAVLVAVRFGVLAGSARAYVARPWTYWLAPLADCAVVVALAAAALRRRPLWRGRRLVPAETR